MCGIAGYMGTRTLGSDTIDRCLARMHHRGPDHAGFAQFHATTGHNAYLLATRLDIIDLQERSNQPLRVGAKTIAYNGELYNYVELRDALKARGHEFRTASDTEVLLSTFDEGGTASLDACEGMWAFAVYDDAAQTLTLSRDRFGEKPLYLYTDETGLYFGSEAKFIFELLGRRLAPNADHLLRYLVNGYKALYKQPTTFFNGLEELAPGTALELDATGGRRVERYWQPPLSLVRSELSRADAVAQVRELLIRSVELRLRADVPLAFAMSGGIDSLSLISIAKRLLGYDVHGFTIVNQDERYSEQDLVDLAVAELGIRHTGIAAQTDGFLPKMRELVRHHDAPVATISFFVHWLLMQAVSAEGYRIAVSGIGGDELFSGYYDHHLAYLYEVRGDAALHAAALEAWLEHVAPIVRNPFLQNPRLFEENPGERSYIYLNSSTFETFLTEEWHEAFAETRFSEDLLKNRMLNEVFHETVPVMLHEDDLNAMHFSIENRSPFLDRALFEYASTIPTAHLVRDGYVKSVLRDAMRGIVPDEVLDSRRKVGFNAPVLDLIDGETREYLLDSSSPLYELVRRDSVVDLLDRDFLPNSESKFLFNVLNAKLFLDEFGA
jgi:asparagine synthase (glutamine-hydrolysing)